MSRDVEKCIIAGVDVFVRDGDAGRTLVMLHGIGSNHTSFDSLCRYLPTDIRVIAWDAPGYGQSRALEVEKPVARDYAEKLHEVVDCFGVEHFSLLGHSLGTLIAVDYASLYPASVDALILLSCAQGYEMQAGGALPEKAQQRLSDLEAEGPLVFAQNRAPRLLHEPHSKPELASAAVEAMSRINPDGYRQAVFMLAAGNLEQAATHVRGDSLVITANEDVITPTSQSRCCHDALGQADATAKHLYVEIPGAGHLVHQEEPALVAKHIVVITGWDTTHAAEQTA